jgi:hypothetical protein
MAIDDQAVITLGETDWRNERRRFGIRLRDLMIGGAVIFGRTGMGKSALIKRMIVDALQIGGLGIALVDPAGDLAEEALEVVPESRLKDVISFAPHYSPIAWNPLQGFDRALDHLTVSGIIRSFQKIWPEYMGPRMEHALRYSLLSLLSVSPNPTLADVPRVFTDLRFRKEVQARLTDQQLLDFWREYEGYNKAFRQEMVSPIMNKIGALLASPVVKEVIGARRSAFSMRGVMDSGQVLIGNLSVGQLGADAARLLSSLLLSQLEVAAVSRSDLPETDRKPFLIFVDEAHTMRLPDTAPIRKFGVALVAATQRASALDPEDRANLLANVGTLVAFRVGLEDAELLEAEFLPEFNRSDLVNLERYAIRLKLMVSGAVSRPFSARTLPPPEGTPTRQNLGDSTRKR